MYGKEYTIHTFTLKSSACCDALYSAGNFIMLSELHILSNRPIANGGAAVNSLKK